LDLNTEGINTESLQTISRDKKKHFRVSTSSRGDAVAPAEVKISEEFDF